VHTTRGSLVHRALELLFVHPAEARTEDAALASLDQAIGEYRNHPDFTDLDLSETAQETFFTECRQLVASYLRMEDPRSVRDIGLELRLEAPVGSLTLRGIIDRLELDEQGGLVVTDYKTGRAPSPNYEQKSLSGVQFYAFLCHAVFGQRPAAVRLMYLRAGEIITATPTEQSVRFVTTRSKAVLQAVEKACTTGQFLPRPSALCNGCSFKQWCPAFGGTPELAAVQVGQRTGAAA